MSRSDSCVRIGPYATVRCVTSAQSGQVSREQHVEWLTPNPFDGKQPVLFEEGGPWHITPHWAFVEGRATLVGLDIRSFTEPWIEDPAHPDGGYEGPRQAVDLSLGLAEVTQKVLREVSITEVRNETAAHLANALGDLSSSLDEAYQRRTALSLHAAEVASSLTQSGKSRVRRPAAGDALLSRVAAYYNEAVRIGSKTPVKYAEDRLRASGAPVSERGGRVQVRKWVQRARQKGLIPPA
jgi:hypothetical protein